jgi:hypothetical protein
MSDQKCSIPECQKTASTRKLCPMHYERVRKHGSPHILLKKGRKPIDIATRMSVFVEQRDPQECWPWHGSTSAGYGQIQLSGRKVRAHRVAYQLAHHLTEIPEGMQVLHSCDRPTCINPGHLRLGSHAENMADKKARGRARNGHTGPLVPRT